MSQCRARIRHLIISDCHYPHHDEEAIAAIVRDTRRRVEYLHILGDFYDLAGLSRYTVSLAEQSQTVTAIHEGRRFLESVIRQIKPERCLFYYGNHELRIAKYLREHAPVIESVVEPDSLLVPCGASLVNGPWRTWECDGLRFTHGAVVRGFPGRTAEAHLDETVCGVVVGHSHRLAVAYIRNRVVVESGHLSRPADLGYLKQPPNWTLGYVTITNRGQVIPYSME